MSTGRQTRHRGTGTHSDATLDGLPAVSRYDAVLAVIPLLFALALAGHALLPVSLQLAVAAGALASSLFLADALFLSPP
ncbi:MAG: hypothetical protein V5A39_10530 [Haloarculaceae archaeon]